MIVYPAMEKLLGKVDSPYTLVILTARRARQLNLGGEGLLAEYRTSKPVSRSLEEVDAGKITYRKNYLKGIK